MTENTRGPFRDSTQGGKTQTGSIIEFMFVDHGYLATSYPYPPTKERIEKRYIAKEGLPDDMEQFLEEENHVYIINASANAYNCWIFVYWTRLGEYDEQAGGEIGEYPQIMHRLNDFQNKSRGRVRSTAFGSGKETIFLRASNGQHHWSFRWNDLPFGCEMMIQDSLQQSGWRDRRTAIEGKKPERIQYYKSDPVEERGGESSSKRRDGDANKRAEGCIRFLTLGKNDAWIIYGETWHIWDKSKNKLPEPLLKGLEMGKKYQWFINKVELSLFNEEEYVLVYDEGPVFYNILSATFVVKFKKVVKQWADSKGVDVFYNEEIVPEKIRSSRNIQTYLLPLDDDESAASQTLPSSTYDTIPEYTTDPPEPFPTIGDEIPSKYHGVESAPQRINSNIPLPTSPTEEESAEMLGGQQRQSLNDPSIPRTGHSRGVRGGSGGSNPGPDQGVRGPIGMRDIVGSVRRRFTGERGNP